MSYVGDFALGKTFDVKFSTVNTSGAPTTLAGSPVVSAYLDNNTTQLTAGITLSVDFDGVTGLHNVRVVATTGNGYATATNYQLVITTGTVGGTSVVGYVVAEFSIENRTTVLSPTSLQAISKIEYGCKGTVWHVSEGGSDAADGLTWATPLLTLTQGVTNHAANDTIVARGAITNNSAVGQLLDGASIVNALGQPRAIVTSSFGTSGGRFILPGARSVIRGFKLNMTDSSGNLMFPIGLFGDTAKSDWIVEDMHIISDTDGVFVGVANCLNVTIRKNRFETKYDAVNVFGATCTVLVEDNDFIVTGPSAAAGDPPTNCVVQGVGTGLTIVRRNRLKASGSITANWAIQVGAGTVHAYDNVFDTSGTAAADLKQTGGTLIDYGNNRGSGTGGAPTTSGTITNRKGHSGIDMATIKPSRLIVVDSATFTPTTTAFETEQTTDESAFYGEQVLYALDGTNAGMTVRITAYAFTNSKVKLTVDALKVAPADGDRFTMYGRIEQ